MSELYICGQATCIRQAQSVIRLCIAQYSVQYIYHTVHCTLQSIVHNSTIKTLASPHNKEFWINPATKITFSVITLQTAGILTLDSLCLEMRSLTTQLSIQVKVQCHDVFLFVSQGRSAISFWVKRGKVLAQLKNLYSRWSTGVSFTLIFNHTIQSNAWF